MFQYSWGFNVVPFLFFVFSGQNIFPVFHSKPSLAVSCCLMSAAPQNIKRVNDDRSHNMVHIFVKNKIFVDSCSYSEKDVLFSAFLLFTQY